MNDIENKEFKHTQCEWKPFRFRPVPERNATFEEIKSMLCESVDRTVEHGDSINDFYMVLSQWDDDPVYMALVGNGPTSEENARFIATAPDMFNVLVDAFFGEATASEETRYKWQMIIEKATGLSIQEVMDIVSTRRANANP